MIDKPDLLLHASYIVSQFIRHGHRGYLRRGEPNLRLDQAGTVSIVELEQYGVIQDLQPTQALWQAFAAREKAEDKPRLYFSRGRNDAIMAIGAYQGHSRKMLRGVRLSNVMYRHFTLRELRDLPLYAYHGTRRGAVELISRNGLRPGGEGGNRQHIHLVKDIFRQSEQAGLRSGSTHVVVVPLRKFATDCLTLAPGSVSIWESYNGVFLTEGKMPAGFYDDDGESIGTEEQRQQGHGIPVAYISRIFVLATGQNMIVLNTGVPEAERTGCFGTRASLELVDEEGRHLSKRLASGDLSQVRVDLAGVPDYPHPGVPDVRAELPAAPEENSIQHQVDAGDLAFDDARLKEDCAHLLVQAAAEQFCPAPQGTGVPTSVSNLDEMDKAIRMEFELLNSVPTSDQPRLAQQTEQDK